MISNKRLQEKGCNQLYSVLINYCAPQIDYMDGPSIEEEDLAISIKSRDFKCPCGKTYLSYAALFTHIKQKHQGKAPGKIIKPNSLHSKRGRPPLRVKQERSDSAVRGEQALPTSDLQHPSPFPEELPQQRFRREQIAEHYLYEAAELLNSMPEQQLNRSHLGEIEAFPEMAVHLGIRGSGITIVAGNICLGDGLTEYFKGLSSLTTTNKFNCLYILYMLFLQFVIDSQNSKTILHDTNLDVLCEYVNDFVENNLSEMAEYYSIEGLWILQRDNSVRLLFNFFTWAMHKRYVSYLVGMQADPFGKASETTCIR